jgi:hypothetical protein
VSDEEREYLNEMIRSLNNQLVDALRERDEMHRELRAAETESSMLRVECGVIAKERDEARREVCECKCSPPKTPFFGAPQELAEVNGWDCFKEDRK